MVNVPIERPIKRQVMKLIIKRKKFRIQF